MAIFTDIDFVAIDEAEPPDAFELTFDVIYAGETWCRSVVGVETAVVARLERDEIAVISAARGALLELLTLETTPVSFHLRLALEGTTVLARAAPGG
jgi:hypothetical protein